MQSLSPVSLKLAKSNDDSLPRCISPALLRKKKLAEMINEIISATSLMQKTKLCFKALIICSEDESIYSNEMRTIVQNLKDSIFTEKSKVDYEVLSYIYEKYLDALVDNEILTLFYVVEGYQSVLTRYKEENTNLKLQMSQRLTEKKEELKEKRVEISKLQAKIEMNLKEPLKLKEIEIKGIEEKYNKNLKLIEELKNLVLEKDDIIKKFKSQSTVHSKAIYDFQCLDEENKMRIKELNENLQNVNSELRKTLDESYRKQHNLEIMLHKLKGGIEREKELEERINFLEEENADLAHRAGLGFENLTPRPSFSGLENFIQDPPKSTQKKVEKISEVLMMVLSNKNTANRKKITKHKLPLRMQEGSSEITDI